MNFTFKGYVRNDGTAGTRNYVGIVPSVICSSTVVKKISDQIPTTVPFTHANGCAQLGDDLKLTKNMLRGVSLNPNLYATLLVGLGCETNQIGGLMKQIPKTKPIKSVQIQQLAGGKNTIEKGAEIVKKWSEEAKQLKREDLPLSQLTIGIINIDLEVEDFKTLGPVLGETVDSLINKNAKVVIGLSETLEPAGGPLADRTDDNLAKRKLIDMSTGLQRLRWGTNPSKTVTDKQLFSEEQTDRAILEAQITGTESIKGLLSYGEIPQENGLYLMNTTNNVVESLSKMTSSGCNIILLLSNRGILTGASSVPSMLITPDQNSEIFNDLIDHRVKRNDVVNQSKKLMNKLLSIASGEQTNLEKLELGEFSIPHVGTTY